MFKLTRITKFHVVLVLALLVIAAMPVFAAEIRVDGKCTLREAIKAANQDREHGGCEGGEGEDVIVMTRDSSPMQGQLRDITSKVTLEGANHKLTLDKNHPVFRVHDGNLTIRNLEIVYSKTRKKKVFEVDDGTLTLINVTVSNCTVGVEQEDGHTSIRGDSNICDLPANAIVTGHGTSNLDLPAPALPQTCATLSGGGAAVTATFGLASGVQCRQVDGAGIGIQSVIDAGFMDAVDVWGYVGQGIEICFPQLGSLTFLDASTSPRAVSTIQSVNRNGQTCTTLTRAGTVVLVPGAPSTVEVPVAAQPSATTTTTTTITGCAVTAIGHLKFLDAPKSEAEIIGWITRGSNLAYVSHILGWNQVSHGGQTGWVGGKYSVRGASC